MGILRSKVYVDKRSNDLINAIDYVFANALTISERIQDRLEITIEGKICVALITYRHEDPFPFLLTLNYTDGHTDTSEHQDAVCLISRLLLTYTDSEFSNNWDRINDFYVTP